MSKSANGGVKQYAKLLEFMADGRWVTRAEVETAMKDSGLVMARFPAYLWDIKHYAQGNVEAKKEGRKVVAYRVTNPEKFKGFKAASTAFAGKPGSVKAAAKKAKPAKAPKASKPAKKAKVVKPKAPAKTKTVRATEPKFPDPAKAPKVAKAKTVKVKPAVTVKETAPVSHVAVDPDFDAMPEVPDFMDRHSGVITPAEV